MKNEEVDVFGADDTIAPAAPAATEVQPADAAASASPPVVAAVEPVVTPASPTPITSPTEGAKPAEQADVLTALQSLQKGLQNTQQEIANLSRATQQSPNDDKLAARKQKLRAAVDNLDALVEQAETLGDGFMDDGTKTVFKGLVAGVAGMRELVSGVQAENQRLQKTLQQQAAVGQVDATWAAIAKANPCLDINQAQTAFAREFDSLRSSLGDEAALVAASHNWQNHILPSLLNASKVPTPVPTPTPTKPTNVTPGGASVSGGSVSTQPPVRRDAVSDALAGKIDLFAS